MVSLNVGARSDAPRRMKQSLERNREIDPHPIDPLILGTDGRHSG